MPNALTLLLSHDHNLSHCRADFLSHCWADPLSHCWANFLSHYCWADPLSHYRWADPLSHCWANFLSYCWADPLSHCQTDPLSHCRADPLSHCWDDPLTYDHQPKYDSVTHFYCTMFESLAHPASSLPPSISCSDSGRTPSRAESAKEHNDG
jgi:hypothetical protein